MKSAEQATESLKISGFIVVSDSDGNNNEKVFDNFYASPTRAQFVCQTIFSKVFGEEIRNQSLSDLLFESINRYFLADIKVLEHCLIAENITLYCQNNSIKRVHFSLHRKNKKLFGYYESILNKHQIDSSVSFHQSENFWKNSLTQISIVSNIKYELQFWGIGSIQFLLLLFNKFRTIFSRTDISNRIVFWHSFANNKEKVDFEFLNHLSENKEISVIHPNPYKLFAKEPWNKSIYLLGKNSIGPFHFLKVLLKFLGFRRKFNRWIKIVLPDGLIAPSSWNQQVLFKTKMFLVYNLLSNGTIECAAKNQKLKQVHVFRGGAASGLIYSGICKNKYAKNNSTTILVPHGTEFNILDHFSYFFLDFNVLPSELIRLNWQNQLDNLQNVEKYNHCRLLTGGRIDYELLTKSVDKKRKSVGETKIGIVLTYNTQTYQDKYISDVIESFMESFESSNIRFVIKPRINFRLNLDVIEKWKTKVEVSNQDIFGFLNNVDIILGTVSTYGILTMVVTDAILCDIAAIYYLPDMKYNLEDLGYSYHPTMKNYIYKNKQELSSSLSGFDTIDKYLSHIRTINKETKKYLEFDGKPTAYLEQLIITGK